MLEYIIENEFWFINAGVVIYVALRSLLLNSIKVAKLNSSSMEDALRAQLDAYRVRVQNLKNERGALQVRLRQVQAAYDILNQEEVARRQNKAEAYQREVRKQQEELAAKQREELRKAQENMNRSSTFDYKSYEDLFSQFSNGRRGKPFDDIHFDFGGAQRGQSQPKQTMQEIKATYRAQAKIHHPDVVKAKGGSPADIERAEKKMQELNAQYEKDKARYK